MRLSNRLRTTLAGACHALGAVWAIAATLRLVFGIAVTFPLLPPLDLARVQVLPAFAASLGLFLLGALIGRSGGETVLHEGQPVSRPALAEPSAPDQAMRSSRVAERVSRTSEES